MTTWEVEATALTVERVRIVGQQRVTALVHAEAARHQGRAELCTAWTRYAHLIEALAICGQVDLRGAERYRDTSASAMRRELDELCRALAKEAVDGAAYAERGGERTSIAAARAEERLVDALTSALSAQLDVVDRLQRGGALDG
jgi:hypothetical protein